MLTVNIILYLFCIFCVYLIVSFLCVYINSLLLILVIGCELLSLYVDRTALNGASAIFMYVPSVIVIDFNT